MVTEADISRTLFSHYRSNGFRVKTEVPLLSKRIDVAAYNPDSEVLILVEAKVHDWKSGLRQASIYTLCTSSVYIAIAKKYCHRVDTDLVQKMGLGFLEVDGGVTSILEPSEDSTPQPSVRERVIKSMESSRGGDF